MGRSIQNGSEHSEWLMHSWMGLSISRTVCALPDGSLNFLDGLCIPGWVSQFPGRFVHSWMGLSISGTVYAFLRSAVTQICSRPPPASWKGTVCAHEPHLLDHPART